MSMTDDDKALVERLRDWGDTIDPGVVICGRKTIETAADRIEALSKENDRLNANLAVEAKFVDKLSAENERLRDVLEGIARESSDTWAKRDARAALGETK